MKYPKFKLLTVFLCFVFLVTTAASCSVGGEKTTMSYKNKTLEFWGVFDDAYFYENVIASYRLSRPNINVKYRKFRYDEYEDELLNALAEDRGPDLFMMHNTWVGKYLPKLEPSPPKITLPYKVTKGSIRKQTFIEMRETKGVTNNDVITNFVDQVTVDGVRTYFDPNIEEQTPPQVYALPMGFDNLVMFYNKDILNNAGIPLPARSWTEFHDHVKAIVRLDSQGNILLAGAALGTSDNVERSSDILSLLMMQAGAEMADGQSVTFHEKPLALKNRPTTPGIEALRFYVDFASPIKEVYTWNSDMMNSLEAFITGKVGYFFGYSYHIPIIKSKSPKLNFALSKVPQIAGSKAQFNYANYFMVGVSKKGKNILESWDFVKYATMNKEAVKMYLDAAQKPTALRELIAFQQDDLDLKPFVSQLLTSKSWYLGDQPLVMERVMEDLIDDANKGDIKLTEALGKAASRVQQTMRRN